MALVEIRDRSIWQKHVAGSPELVQRLAALAPEEKINLKVAGKRGLWVKMRAQPTGEPTPGIRPGDAAASALWGELYATRRGEFVEIALDDPAPADGWREATETDREAAWAAFKALSKAGWRSEGRKLDRTDLHER